MADSYTPSIDMKDLLVAGGIGAFGGTAEWGIFIGREPDSPNSHDHVITLYDTPGDPPDPKFLLDYPRFQVRVRSTDYNDGFQKAEAIKSILLGLPSQVINGTRWVGVWVVIDTHFLYADEKGRAVFVTTYRSIREPNTGQNRLEF